MVKSVNDFFDFYYEYKIKMAGDSSELQAKLSACYDKLDIPNMHGGGGKWMKLKCVQEGEYLCIGTCIIVPHILIDKAF